MTRDDLNVCGVGFAGFLMTLTCTGLQVWPGVLLGLALIGGAVFIIGKATIHDPQ
jgi:hypothetical protein